jgi:glycine oxidase
VAPDVLVVGGGIIGCSIAWRLAQRGARVAIREAGRLGGEASWAAAGMLAPGGEVSGDSPWARRSVESLAMYSQFTAELENETGIHIDYRACGAFELAYSVHELEDITRKAACQSKLGIISESVSEPDIAGLNKKGLAGARYYPNDAVVDPRHILRALEIALHRRGVVIEENTPVEKIDPGAPAVLAAGAWSSALLPGAPESYPVKGHLIGYDLLPGSVGPILRHGHTYLLQRSSGFTIAGSTMERVGFDKHTDPATVARLHERARRYLPTLLHASPEASWTGFRPGVEGDEPQVGRFHDTNVWLAYGHYRNGILLAPITAKLISEAITSSSETD